MGQRAAGPPGDRPLVADRDRLGHRRQLPGHRALPIKPGSATKPVPGYDVRILDGNGKEVPPGQPGVVTVKLPLPPGTLPTLWNADQRFLESYMNPFPGYYFTGDEGFMDEDGYLFIMGRVDDVINVAGHRLSTGAMEEVIAQHPDVAECAVIGAHDDSRASCRWGWWC
jgi:propionyl-CoA synthetase